MVKISGSWIKRFSKLGIRSTRRLNKQQVSVLPSNNERTTQQIAYQYYVFPVTELLPSLERT